MRLLTLFCRRQINPPTATRAIAASIVATRRPMTCIDASCGNKSETNRVSFEDGETTSSSEYGVFKKRKNHPNIKALATTTTSNRKCTTHDRNTTIEHQIKSVAGPSISRRLKNEYHSMVSAIPMFGRYRNQSK